MKKKGYKKGGKTGGKMPDLSGDGKVTQKDVLIGRGVVKKQAGGLTKAKKDVGMTPQDMQEAAKNLKDRGVEGPDQPLLEMKKSLKGKKRNVSPEETRARRNKGGMKKKGYAKGGKVRGAGIARKGTRPCKMR
jgi:hypothetical protein